MSKLSTMNKLGTMFMPVLCHLIMSGAAHAAHGQDMANSGSERRVGQVTWQKATKNDVQSLLSANIPKNMSSIFLLRKLDQDDLQTSANVGINGRFQVSLQPGYYSHVYTCSGAKQISTYITGLKNNNLSTNELNIELKPETVYFLAIDVSSNQISTITPVDKKTAVAHMASMQRQAHQISRLVDECTQPSSMQPSPLRSEPPLQSQPIAVEKLSSALPAYKRGLSVYPVLFIKHQFSTFLQSTRLIQPDDQSHVKTASPTILNAIAVPHMAGNRLAHLVTAMLVSTRLGSIA